MSNAKDDEEYWNSNEKNFFCFEPNEDSMLGMSKSGTAFLRAGIANIGTSDNYISTDEPQWNFLKPLESIVPEKTLSCILETNKDFKSSEELSTEKPQITAKKILLGQPYSLEQYKSLASKTALLDAIIASGDGNAILGIVLFLTKTLKKSLVHSLLSKRPEANQIYLHYLSTRMQITEIVELLKMQGQMLDAAMRNLHIIIKNTSNTEKLLQKLRVCYKTLFMDMPECRETAYVHSYIQLLEWQLAVKDNGFTEQFVQDLSVLDCLRHTCRDYWNTAEGNLLSPSTLQKQFQISPRQYQMVAVSTRASVQEWEEIDVLLHTKNWLGAKKFQTILPVEDILKLLHKNGAPSYILEKYLNYVDNVKRRLDVAVSLKCHKSVIDILANQGDRKALQEYRNCLKNEDPSYDLYAESVLQRPTIKWKN